MQDATEFKALEAKFTQSQRMQAIGQLAGGVAHDFNNLLTAISGHCDLILLRHDRSDVDYPDLMQIQQNTNRAAALVRQLAGVFAQADAAIRNAGPARHCWPTPSTCSTGWSANGHPDPAARRDMPLIRSDKRQFEQVLDEPCRQCPRRDADGRRDRDRDRTLRLPDGLQRDKATRAAGEYAVIRVRDEGVGMSPATLAKVFDPFFSTKRQGEGTGLGLSTVYGIIKQSGGFIFVDSTEGQRHDFLDLFRGAGRADCRPVAPRTRQNPDNSPQPQHNPAGRGRGPCAIFAARALQLQGHQVLEADSGEAALDLLQDPTVQPDVFVSDVIMPGLDGPGWVADPRPVSRHTHRVHVGLRRRQPHRRAQTEFGQACSSANRSRLPISRVSSTNSCANCPKCA